MRVLVYKTAQAASEVIQKVDEALGLPNPFVNAITYCRVRRNRKGQGLLIFEDAIYSRVKSLLGKVKTYKDFPADFREFKSS